MYLRTAKAQLPHLTLNATFELRSPRQTFEPPPPSDDIGDGVIPLPSKSLSDLTWLASLSKPLKLGAQYHRDFEAVNSRYQPLEPESNKEQPAASSSSLSPRPLLSITMSLDPPPYLGSVQNNVRQRPIPWDGAARAGTITEAQLAKIRAVDKVKKEQRKQVVEGDLDGYRILFVGEPGTPGVLESASKRSDVIQYILVLLSDLLEGVYLSAYVLSYL